MYICTVHNLGGTLFSPSDTIFPIKLLNVLHSIRAVRDRDCFALGLELGLSAETLNDIEDNHPTCVETRRRKMIQQWMSSPTLQPSWYSLVDALDGINMTNAAKDIAKERSEKILYNNVCVC